MTEEKEVTVKFENYRMFIMNKDKDKSFAKIAGKMSAYHKKCKKEIEKLLNHECEVHFTMTFHETKTN